MRAPTLEEELAAFHRLAWHIDLQRTITMNHEAVVAALNRLSAWVAAHSDQNGERPAAEVQRNVVEAFWKQIAQREPGPAPERSKPSRARKVKP